jgi:predicted ribosomally synthesized peptide with SipW-like signal peptide
MTARHRKILLTLLLIGATSALAGVGTFSAFSSTTTNSGNSFAAGTVFIDDNDAGSAMYTVSNQVPGTTVERCIKLTYGGTRAADVRLYTPTASVGTVADYVNLTVEKGTLAGNPAFPGCGAPGDFTAQGAPLYSGELDDFVTAKNSYANGIPAFPGAQTQWNQNDTLVYRFQVALQDDNNANGGATPLSTGSHAFTWEARNQ